MAGVVWHVHADLAPSSWTALQTGGGELVSPRTSQTWNASLTRPFRFRGQSIGCWLGKMKPIDCLRDLLKLADVGLHYPMTGSVQLGRRDSQH